jgi:hypothetical protein
MPCLFCKMIQKNASYCSGDNQGPADGNKRKRKGARNSVASIKPVDTTLGISKKQSRIPAMVMWYLPVANRLRRFLSNPKDAELMRWCDSDKRKMGDGKLRHPADACQ